MKLKMLSVLAVLMSTSGAFADMHGTQVYFADYNYSGVAFGKQVKSVMVHTGILREASACAAISSPYWDSVTDVQMKKVGDHFFAQARLSSELNECSAAIDGPMVQYWVTYEDGSSMKSDPTLVEVTTKIDGGWNWEAVDQTTSVSEAAKTDASTTYAISVYEGTAD